LRIVRPTTHVRVRVQELPQPSSAKEWLRWQQMELAA
jgi:hypothetical protein